MSRTPQKLRDVTGDREIRFSTGMGELDRVLGGGAVAGPVTKAVYDILFPPPAEEGKEKN